MLSAPPDAPSAPRLAVIGGGPAGLMAAEVARAAGAAVELFDAMGSVGRKFLLAGKGGLNLTHSEPFEPFVARFHGRSAEIRPWLEAFDADALRDWARGLGVETVVGSSGRVFPADFKAAPLLRGWVRRLRESGVRFHVQHHWQGWDADGQLRFTTPTGVRCARFAACVLALGGGSWPVLGSDGQWQALLAERGIDLAPLRPANCGFEAAWSAPFAERWAGAPVKPVQARLVDAAGCVWQRQGEFIVTREGVEGSLIYALSAPLRETLEAHGSVTLELDLLPGRRLDQVEAVLQRPRGGRSLSEFLRRGLNLGGVRAALLRECHGGALPNAADALARSLKALPLRLTATRPLAEAISSAGGVRFAALDDDLMLRELPGVFCAGEMIDWEAPTGGYLLTACCASGRIAGAAAARWAMGKR